jgi:hypothetical protein
MANSDLEPQAVLFAAEALDAERRFVSAGFWYPAEMHTEAVERGISTSSFSDPQSRWLFEVLCRCREQGFVPTEDNLMHIHRETNGPFPLKYNPDALKAAIYLEAVPTGISVWADDILANIKKRKLMAKLEAAMRRLVA